MEEVFKRLDCEQSLFFFGILERTIMISRAKPRGTRAQAESQNRVLHYPKEK